MTDWPVQLRGITECVITTKNPDGRWNVAALGLHEGDPVTARTWGDTRTKRNLTREPDGYLQFTRDPVTFVDAALAIRTVPDPILSEADAWVRVSATRLDEGESEGTHWVDWALRPTEIEISRQVVPVINRGFNAVVEATVAASRLDVPAFDSAELTDNINHLEVIVQRCGGDREHAAFSRLHELIDAETL